MRGLSIAPLASLPGDMHDLAPVASRLLLAAAPIFEDLAERWPVGTIPDVMGLVSDGDIIAINQAEPSGLRAEWLSIHASRCQPATMIPMVLPQQ